MPILLVYAFAALLCSFARFAGEETGLWLEFLTKPLLMPLLAVYFAQYGRSADVPRIRFYLALFFAWGGDMLLMFAQPTSPHALLFFLGGLGSFLVMQLLYWNLYSVCRMPSTEPTLLRQKPYLLLPVVLVAAAFYWAAFPQLDLVLRIAVAIYAVALSGMVILSLQRWQRTPPASFWAVFIGASLFMISDLMIGLNRFVAEFPLAGPAIMLTYTLGQGLIVGGLAKHGERG